MRDGTHHLPVLLDEVVEAVEPALGTLVIDGTFGAGGYSRAFLERGATVIGIDRDPTAHGLAATNGLAAHERLTLVADRFSNLDAHAEMGSVDAVVLDVGVSSMQIDEAERGFSFMRDGPLDMRMDGEGPSAAAVVNGLAVNDLIRVIGLLGEEKNAPRLAHAIDRARTDAPIETTGALAKVIETATPRRAQDKVHPATRTFQGIRIYVNDELNELARALRAAERALKPGGRLVVVSFHSLEDRIVKRFIADRSGSGGASRHMPAAEVTEPTFEPLGKQGRAPSEAEVAGNPRARSARIRAAIRTNAPARDEKFEPIHKLPPLSKLAHTDGMTR